MTILAFLPALAPVAVAQNDLLSRIFVFDRYGELLQMLQNSIFAGAVLGLIGGFVGIFVMMRDHAFAVHGISEMSFAGAALALLLGYDVVTGSMVGSIASALLIAFLGSKASNSNSVIGALMPFGLGLGILFLSLVFMVILGIAVALSVQVVGSLLVLALLITPAAAAMQVTASPVRTLILSVLFAEASIVGGILLALAGSLPISPYVTSISFLIYVVCRVIGGVKRRHSASGRQLTEKA